MKIAGLILAESLVFHPKFIKAFCLLNLSDLGDAVVSCAAVSSTLPLLLYFLQTRKLRVAFSSSSSWAHPFKLLMQRTFYKALGTFQPSFTLRCLWTAWHSERRSSARVLPVLAS